MASGGRAARLAPVVDMAEKAEKAAAQRLGHFQGQVNLANSKLGDLENFRADYQSQWVDRGSQGVSGPMAAQLSVLPWPAGNSGGPAAPEPGVASEQPGQGPRDLATGLCPGRRVAQTGAALRRRSPPAGRQARAKADG